MWTTIFCFVVITSFSGQFVYGQEQCTHTRTYPCQNNPGYNDPSTSIVQGLPGKRGAIGERGPPGQKGEPGTGSIVLSAEDRDNKITQLEEQIETLESKLDETTTQLHAARSNITDLLEFKRNVLQVLETLKKKSYTLKVTEHPGNFNAVRQMCIYMGGDLLRRCLYRHVDGVTYERALSSILDMNFNTDGLWIGARAQDNRWIYVSGKKFRAHPHEGHDLLYFWGSNQPDTLNQCAAFRLISKDIHDYPCFTNFFGICEVRDEDG